MALVQESLIGMLRVFVVAEHDVVREGLASVLDAENDLEVVADTGHIHDLVAKLEHQSPAVVVVDHAPPQGDGLRLCRLLSQAGVNARVVLLVDEPNGDSVEQALGAGARACVAKDVRSEVLVAAVRAAASDAPDIQPTTGKGGVPTLGRSQLAVLRLLVEGKSVAQIAEEMGLSPHTVRSYLRQIYRRLGVSSRAEATAVALRLRLL